MFSKQEAIAEWGKINSAPYDEGNQTDRAAIFLICAIGRNNSYSRIAGETCFKPSECRMFKGRAEDSKIMVGRKLQGDWLDEELGGINFIMDAMCVSGRVERSLTI